VSYDDVISAILSTAGGVPVVEIIGGSAIVPFYLVGAPGVKSMADLKGKRVGSSGLGPSASRVALLVALRRLGVDVEKDQITGVAAGQEPERRAALAAGAIAACVISTEYRPRLDQLGLPILADLRTMNIPWEAAALLTTRQTLQGKREAIERLLRGLLEAN